MTERNLAFLLLAPVLLICGLAFSVADTQQEAPAAQLDNPNDIEQYVADTRAETEAYYKNKLQQLRKDAKEQIDSFAKKRMDQIAVNAVSEDVLIANNGFVPKTYTKLSSGLMLPTKEVDRVKEEIAQKEKEIKARLAKDEQRLEQQRAYILNVQLPKTENRLKQDISGSSPAYAPANTRGVVAGIVYSTRAQFALIDENIVSPRDVIYGVTVTRIHPNIVEFKKNDNEWKQKVRQRPSIFWTDSGNTTQDM